MARYIQRRRYPLLAGVATLKSEYESGSMTQLEAAGMLNDSDLRPSRHASGEVLEDATVTVAHSLRLSRGDARHQLEELRSVSSC
jgi:hypothetical protein